MIEVKVPATSANMGPGFDCFGIALNIYNHFFIEEKEYGLEFDGCDEEYKNEDNLVYTSIKKFFDYVGYKPNGLKIKIKSDIPVSRGLGSSAACILGGVLAADEIAGGVLKKDEILSFASEIEGHPDNIAPALLGGMIISIKDGKKIYYDKLKLSGGFKFCAIIPDFKLSTKKSREALPDTILHRDGVFNVGRASLMLAALTNGNIDLFKFACEDRLHQVYRGSLIENYDEIVEESKRQNCLGVFLSGAGPSIMAVLKEDDSDFANGMETFLHGLKNKWTVKELKPDFEGSVVNIY